MTTKRPYITPLIQVLDLMGEGVMESIGGGSGSDNPTEADSKPSEWNTDDEPTGHSLWDNESTSETY